MWLAVPRFSARKTPNWVSWEYYEDEVADDGCNPDPALAALDAFLQLVDLFDEQDDVEHADRHEGRRDVHVRHVDVELLPQEYE